MEISKAASPIHICILGGGFAGLFTGLYLHRIWGRRSRRIRITLVDQNDYFLFTPFLYELVTGELNRWEIAPPFKKLLTHTGINFCQDHVQHVDLDRHQVILQSDRVIDYSYLVLATGRETALEMIPGASDHALPFRSIPDALRLNEQLSTLERSEAPLIRVAVIGGGPSGIELAGKISDRLQERGCVHLIDRGRQLLGGFSPFGQTVAHRSLTRRRVQIHLETRVLAIAPRFVRIAQQDQSQTIDADLVIVATGTEPSAWVNALPCKQSLNGQLLTHPTLQLLDYPNVFALGDVATSDQTGDRPLPATAQVAFQQASCTARNLWATLHGKPLRPFRYIHLGEMLTLGTTDAIVFSFGIGIQGKLAGLARRLIYILLRMPTRHHRLQIICHRLKHWLYQRLNPIRRLFSPTFRRKIYSALK